MNKLSVRDLLVKGKKVLVRVDFNVPLDDAQHITDDTRIVESILTIKYLLEAGAAVILMSHLGRPKGKKVPEYSLKVCAERLSQILGLPVKMAPDCVGNEVQSIAAALKPGDVLLLENLRFHAAEENPEIDINFAKNLASLGDFYVNDAFGAAHREHSSITSITQYFKGKSATGFLLEKEIHFLGDLLLNPKRPFYAIVGGAKISSKLGVLHALLKKVDILFVGGGMSYTFLKAQGIPIGNSICEDALLEQARKILEYATKNKIRLELPQDNVVADFYGKDASYHTVFSKNGIPDGFMGMDIGPKTCANWSEILQNGKTIFWNGPLGVAEFPAFSKGTDAIAQSLANISVNKDAITIVGGGDSVAAIRKLNMLDKFTHISTGGGASLEYIEYGKLPGVEALT